MGLDQRGKVLAEYVWVDAHGGVRSKTKVRLYFLFFPFLLLFCYIFFAVVSTLARTRLVPALAPSQPPPYGQRSLLAGV